MTMFKFSVRLGSYFEQKFGKDPRKLTLEEINAIAIGKDYKGSGYRSNSNVVTSRGSIFKGHFYDIDSRFEEALGK
jgi:hypothetical protein